MPSIPDAYHDLFERPTIAHVGTVMPDGTPHVTPVWIGYDAEENRLLVNTEYERQKEANVRREPKVGVSMVDPDDPYRRLGILGEVDEITEEGAREHIDQLARRYTGEDYDPDAIETQRIIIKIRPDRIME